MAQASSLVAWLGVQDCRLIKEHPATNGGVILSALERSGASRLVLLSTLQSAFTHEYLEQLSLAWPGDIELHAFEAPQMDVASLWPWAEQVLQEAGQRAGEAGLTLLLGSGMPACQAVFMAHGMMGNAALMEPRRDGSLQAVTVPRLIAKTQEVGLSAAVDDEANGVSEIATDDWGVEEVALQPVTEIDFSDVPAEAAEAPAQSLTDDCLPEVVPDEWGVEEVALQPVTDIEFPDMAIEDAATDGIKGEDFAGGETVSGELATDGLSTDDLPTEQTAAETFAADAQSGTDDDLRLEFPDVSEPAADPFDFDADLKSTGLLDAEPPADADEFERLKAEFGAAAEEPIDPFADLPATTDEEPAATQRADDGLADELNGALAALSDEPGQTGAFDSSASSVDLPDADETVATGEPVAEAVPESEPVLPTAAAPTETPTAPAVNATPWPYPSAALSVLVRRADTVAESDSAVLVLGEPGCGARLLAARIHERSARSSGPLILADLSTVHVDAQAQELWGEVNPLTGSHTPGFVELAQGGTLLITGLELMTPLVQSQLLTLMMRGDCLPMGAEQPVPADVRIVAVAADSLLAELKAGRFNRALFDQFGRGLLTIPALRNRQQDLPALLSAMWVHIRDTEDPPPLLTAAATEWLLEHGFSGSVRDLECALRRAVLWTRGEEVSVETLRESMALASVPDAVANCTQAIRDGFSLKDVVFSVTKHFVHQALVQTSYDLDKAAALLGVADSQALLGWMARVDIVLPSSPGEMTRAIPEASFDLVSDEAPVFASTAEPAISRPVDVSVNEHSLSQAASILDGDFDLAQAATATDADLELAAAATGSDVSAPALDLDFDFDSVKAQLA